MATESTSILRHRRNGGATAIPWSTLQDPNLSFTARGVLAYCLSLPEGWAFSAKRIAASTPHQGQQAVLTALKQLEKAGYRKVTTERGKRGRFRKIVEFSYVPVPEWIQDDNQDEQTFPQVAPKPGKPSLGNLGLGGPGKTDVSTGRAETRETEAREPETLRGVNPEGYTHTAREASTESAAAVEADAVTGVCVNPEAPKPSDPEAAVVDVAMEGVRGAVEPSIRHLLGEEPASSMVRGAVVRCLTAGHTPTAIARAVAGRTNAGTIRPDSVAANALNSLAKKPPASTGVTPTPGASGARAAAISDCGQCDQAGWVELDNGRLAKCRHDNTIPAVTTTAPQQRSTSSDQDLLNALSRR